MDPTLRNTSNLGSTGTPTAYTTNSQAGFTYQVSPQMAAYQQTPGKLPGMQSFMGNQMGTFVRGYQPISQEQNPLLTNVQGGYMTATSQVNTLPSIATFQGQGQINAMTTSAVNALPSMGTFVSNVNQAGNTGMAQLYRSVGTWQGQGQSAVSGLVAQGQGQSAVQSLIAQGQGQSAVSGLVGQGQPAVQSLIAQGQGQTAVPGLIGQTQGGNTLPSFGQFFMPQQFQQNMQQFQAHHISPSMMQSSPQQPENLPNLYHLNQAMVNPGQINIAQATAKYSANFGALLNQNQPNAVPRHVTMNLQVPMSQVQNIQNPDGSIQMIQQSCTPNIVASCNQITNTTSSVVMVTCPGTTLTLTANVHVKTSVASTSSAQILQSPRSSRCSSRSSEGNSLSGFQVKEETVKQEFASSCSQLSRGSSVTEPVVVPFGWKRQVIGSAVVYESPSGVPLHSLEEISHYLATDGTCKCGLECPVLVNRTFNFNTTVRSRPWSLDIDNAENMTKLCNHKRKIVAMATFQSSRALSESCQEGLNTTTVNKKDTKSRKKKGRANHQNSSYDGLLVSQLIAQRDRMKNNPPASETAKTTACQSGPAGQQSIVGNPGQQCIMGQPGNQGKVCVPSSVSVEGGEKSTCPQSSISQRPSSVSVPDSISHLPVSSALPAHSTSQSENRAISQAQSTATQQPSTAQSTISQVQCSEPNMRGVKTADQESHFEAPSCQQIATAISSASDIVMSPPAVEKGQRSEVKDPGDDLGPISSGKQIKLDFSKEITQPSVSGRSSQPLQSPNHPLLSPGAGMMSPGHQMVNRSPSHQLQSPTHLMGSRPVSRPPSQPLVSPTGTNCQTNMPHMISPKQAQYSPLMVQTSSGQEHYQMQHGHGQMRSSPRFTFPPSQIMHPGNSGMLVQMNSGNMQVQHAGMNPAMHHGNFNMGMMGIPVSQQQQQQQGMMGNSQHAPGMMAGMPQGNTPMYQYNTPPPGYPGLPISYMGNAAGPAGMGNPRSPFHMQQGMYHMANPVLSGMFDQPWQEKKKPSKPKKPRAKKERKKTPTSVFESATPPPNVDVSQLKDQGRGPIPKVKASVTSSPSTQSSASFLDNPTAFLAEQTVLISKSLTNTLSSPPHSSSGTSELKTSTDDTKPASQDAESEKKTSVPETTETTTSPNVVVHNTSQSVLGPVGTASSSSGSMSSLAAAVGAVMSNVAKTAMENSSSSSLPGALSSNESHLATNLSDANIFTEDRCESLSPEDSNEECPALTETMTPSSVVHHTPDSNKKEDQLAVTEEEKETSVPGTAQESSVKEPTNLTTEILSKFGPALLSVPAQEKSGILASRTNFGKVHQTLVSTGPEKMTFGPRPVSNYNTLQQMLGHTPASQFPASNLLSAAARAQMAQQNQLNQNGTDVFIGHQPLTKFEINYVASKLATSTSVTSQNLLFQRAKTELENILSKSVDSEGELDSQKIVANTTEARNTTAGPSTQSFNALKKALAATTKSVDTTISLGRPSISSALAISTSSTNSSTAPIVTSICMLQDNMSQSQQTTCTAVAKESISAGQSLETVLAKASVTTARPGCSEQETCKLVSSTPLVPVTSTTSVMEVTSDVPVALQEVVTSSTVTVAKPQQTVTALSLASSLPASTLQQSPLLTVQSQAPSSNLTQVQSQTMANPVSVGQNPTLPVPNMSQQNTLLSSLGNLQQNLNPQSVMNLFQNIGLQQIQQQGQGFNQLQGTQGLNNFQPGPLVMPTGVPQNNYSPEGVQCLQLPQNNFSVSGSFPQLVGQCSGTGFGNVNNQFPGFGLESAFQSNLPKSGQLMQIIPGESQPGCVQIKGAMATQSCDISQPMNKLFTDQAPTSQQGQVVLVPNLQMPMLQVLGANQPVNMPSDKTGFSPQFSQNTDLQGLINQLQSSLSQIGSPLGMVNMQQVVNNLTTGSNLTAMQLQTLQLQQQLLQQIQQLQGMQSLISQINMQGQGSNTITTVANKNNVVMTAGSVSSGNNIENKPDNSSVSMVTMVNDVSTTTESPPHPLLGDEDDDDDDFREEDQEEVTAGVGEDGVTGLEEEEEEGEEMMELNEQNSVDSTDLQSFETSQDDYKSAEIAENLGNDVGTETVDSSCESASTLFPEAKKKQHTNPGASTDISKSDVDRCLSVCAESSDSTVENKLERGNFSPKNSSAIVSDSKNLVQVSSSQTCVDSSALHAFGFEEEDESLDVCSTEGLEHVVAGYSNLLPSNVGPEQSVVMDLSTKHHHGDEIPPSLSSSSELVTKATRKPESKAKTEVTSEPNVMTRSKRSLLQMANPDSSSSEQAVEPSQTVLLDSAKPSAVAKGVKRPLEMDFVMQDEDSIDTVESPCLSAFPTTFTEGDLIWGQIRGFPSWPGKVVPPSDVIDPEPLETGKKWIKWYGDHTFTQVEQEKLKSLTEGLHSHHRAKKKRKGRKMNSNLEAAIQEALKDMDPQEAREMEAMLSNVSSGSKKKKKVR